MLQAFKGFSKTGKNQEGIGVVGLGRKAGERRWHLRRREDTGRGHLRIWLCESSALMLCCLVNMG